MGAHAGSAGWGTGTGVYDWQLLAGSSLTIFKRTQLFNAWQNLTCFSAQTIELDSAQQPTALENEDAAHFATFTDDVVAQDMNTGRR